MEDLWKIKDISYRLGDWADRAEYARLLRSFREQECRDNQVQLLYDGTSLERSDKT